MSDGHLGCAKFEGYRMEKRLRHLESECGLDEAGNSEDNNMANSNLRRQDWGYPNRA